MGTNKHLSMESVFSSLCIFLALLSTASAAGTSIITQTVNYATLTKALYTGDAEKVIAGGYLQANGWAKGSTTDNKVNLETGISYTATVTDGKVKFVVTQGPTFKGTVKTAKADQLATVSTLKSNMKDWKAANSNPNTSVYVEGCGNTCGTIEVQQVNAAVASTPAPTAAPGANSTSSASGGVQFSQIALSIPVVAMVISKIC